MQKKIRVIHIITRLDMGGSAQNTLLTTQNLDPDRYEIVLVKGSTLESGMPTSESQVLHNQLASARNRGVRVINLPYLVRRVSPWNDLRSLVWLLIFSRRYKPDIVHTHTSKAGFVGRLAAWLSRVPVIVHTPHGHVFYGHFGPWLSRFFLLVERLLDRTTHHWIALTPREAGDYHRFKVSKTEKISVIHSGVDVNRFQRQPIDRLQKKKELDIPPDTSVVGFVGWLLPIKGTTFLVQAMAQVSQRHPSGLLVLVGNGEDIQLKKQVESLGLEDKVLFLGWRSDVEEIMYCFDMLALPSLNEGMGRVLVEAMAAGLPIVASRVGGIPDLIQDGKNGVLVPPANPAALAHAISELLDDGNRRKRMGEAGRKMCRPYSTETMVKQISGLYERLVEKYACC
ncbi:MAG: glycosyltransferase family 4 protein [Deltaproteobacteria bacterium]|nr:MAG: glycosyltransferase family 4 protein [Deltaproteobacteria bacterium]